jgi:hypothetical protein
MIRTCGTWIRNPLLYPLSYEGKRFWLKSVLDHDGLICQLLVYFFLGYLSGRFFCRRLKISCRLFDLAYLQSLLVCHIQGVMNRRYRIRCIDSPSLF